MSGLGSTRVVRFGVSARRDRDEPDDATSEIYSAFLVEEEGTASTFCALKQVFTDKGLPSGLYTDRGSHYFHTPEAGGKVDKSNPTQVGRALHRHRRRSPSRRTVRKGGATSRPRGRSQAPLW